MGEKERKAHANKLVGERDRLLERERNTGVLEGRVDAMSAESAMLRQRIADLQKQIVDVEGQKGKDLQEKDQLRSDLESAKKEHDALQKSKEEYQKRLEELMRKKQPKCGCTVM